MASTKPRKPQRGERAMQSMFDTICQIIDFLPSLQVTGDNKTIKVDSFGSGKTISTIKPANSSTNSGGGGSSQQEVFLGQVIRTTSDISNVNVILSNDGGLTYTGNSVIVNLTNIALNSVIEAGTILVVYKGISRIIGGSQNL